MIERCAKCGAPDHATADHGPDFDPTTALPAGKTRLEEDQEFERKLAELRQAGPEGEKRAQELLEQRRAAERKWRLAARASTVVESPRLPIPVTLRYTIGAIVSVLLVNWGIAVLGRIGSSSSCHTLVLAGLPVLAWFAAAARGR